MQGEIKKALKSFDFRALIYGLDEARTRDLRLDSKKGLCSYRIEFNSVMSFLAFQVYDFFNFLPKPPENECYFPAFNQKY